MSHNGPKGLPPLSEKARDKLVRRTRSWFWKRRLAAVEEIVARRDESLLLPLVARLSDPRIEVRLAARRGFLLMPAEAIPTLLIASQIPGLIGARAQLMLRSLQFPNEHALKQLLTDENQLVRSAAVRVAQNLGHRGIPFLIHGLIAELGEGETTWGKQRISGRISHGWMHSPFSGVVRDEIRKALISLGPGAAERIGKYLGHPSIVLRNEILLVLSRFGNEGIRQILKRGMRLPNDLYCGELGKLLAEEKGKHLPMVIRLCGTNDTRVQLCAMKALSSFGEDAWPALIHLVGNLAHENEQVAAVAAGLVNRMSGDGTAILLQHPHFANNPVLAQHMAANRFGFDARQQKQSEVQESIAGLLRLNADWAVRTALNGLRSGESRVRAAAIWVLGVSAPHASEEAKQLASSAVVFTTLGEDKEHLKKLYEALLNRLGKLGPDQGGLSFLAA